MKKKLIDSIILQQQQKMTSSTTTSTTLSDYITDNEDSEYDSEDEPIQSDLEPEFKDTDFTHNLHNNQEIQLSHNIIKWIRTYRYNHIDRFCKSGKRRVKPKLVVKEYEKIRYIVRDNKYYSLNEVTNFNHLRRDDLKIIINNRDEQIVRKDRSINILSDKLDKMTNKFKWAMSKAFQHGFRYSRS